ncbi:hypothetical protein KUTeg_010884 [Tegillarca granosa]|uniref:BTB domain-containing protein n=1 Tax=Tegillarca granosa TaxID=220873 RepID=A0ABQ9F298_TEGGR|nr:hypothetical protein KUTeg_010884 [Tegillarca granosa]
MKSTFNPDSLDKMYFLMISFVQCTLIKNVLKFFFDQFKQVTVPKNSNFDSDSEEDNPFIEEEGITDIALVVEDKKLYVSKALLSIVSPVFKKMFLSNFKEEAAKELPLPGKKFKDVLEFLKVVYPNIQKPLNIHAYHQAVFYLKKKTTKRLSYLYGLKKSYKICLKSASYHNFKKLKSNKFFQTFPDLFVDVGLLVTEARTPDLSVKGRVEGPHCPPIQGTSPHQCDKHREQVKLYILFRSFQVLKIYIMDKKQMS